ncbi:DUF4129 domain-containing protein [Pseudomonas graminis]|uniref:Protein-glutamine gamma-glutamyltransferase-like C-terminal domain-containing protein n=1 Tax=Pseudomonas graminis TaxID=158627 RepID=A0A1H9ZMF8_9PSED|nr:DUF4129 domain-containing protein [Pseudomonas graminis]SES82541.1 protein of unknown function [Pseudomonas graminis]
MRLTDASVVIRPRTSWEAIDLGVLLAQRHRALLMTSWAIVTLPVFALLTLLLWDYPSVAVLVFWWLKPAYERLPLLILSQALFGSAPSLRQALKSLPSALTPQLIASLTWRRLSLSRSFYQPVQQLEGLDGLPRAQRIAVLGQKDPRAARLLTALGSTLEMTFWIGLMVLFYAMIPPQIEADWSWRSLLDIEGEWNWLEHLTNGFYALVLIVWGPVYVSCGFALYLNRRTALEAWDIELGFRNLRQRVLGSALALLLGGFFALTLLPSSVMAASASIQSMPEEIPSESGNSCPLPPLDNPQTDEDVAPPDSPRLLNQPLTSQASQNAIHAVLEQPPFKNPKPVSGWRIAQPKHDAQSAETPNWLARLVVGLLNTGKTLSAVFGALLWALLGITVAWVMWRYRAWFATFVGKSPPKATAPQDIPHQLFGLQVRAETLPTDVADAAERLWQQSPREALSLLYRALLSRLLTDYQLPLKSADTEGQILARIAELKQPPLDDFSHELTRHWQNLAYGHRLPPDQARQTLCSGWRKLFAQGAGA